MAGSVRARALARRRAGRGKAREVAASTGLEPAVSALLETPYGHFLRAGQSLAAAELAIGATLLWHLRVLAGWLPRSGVAPVRALAGWFEIANIESHVQGLPGGTAVPPYRLGALAVAWPRLSHASTLEEVRGVLASSAWADPGAATPRAVMLGVRLSWAQRVVAAIPAGEPWAAGAIALLVAREHFVLGRPLEPALTLRAATLLGDAALAARSLADFTAAIRTPGRWVLAGIDDAADLWRAESHWWRRLEHDGIGLLSAARFDVRAAIGAALVLAVDAWRVRAALSSAARPGALEVFDAVV